MKLWFYDIMMEICWKLEDIYYCFGRFIGLTTKQMDKFYPSGMWESLRLEEAHRRKK